jgi:hypothetical protein
MSKYFVGISETTKGWVEVDADSVEQAQVKAYEAWSDGRAFMDEKNSECSVECTYLKSL